MELHDTEHRIALEQALIYARDLNKTITELRTVHHDLHAAYLDTVHRLAIAAEYRDGDTGGHIRRIGAYSRLIAERLGLPEEQVADIGYAAPMHDVGKIGIPDRILQKPGMLTVDEWDVIKTHPAIGAKILSGSRSGILQCAETIALTHHEKWDGSGYPAGLAGWDIPLVGRIVTIVDVYDALTSQRPYKAPYPVEKARTMIMQGQGIQFDPDMVKVFIACFDEIVQLQDTADTAWEK